MKKVIVPFFIAHQGCPHQCVFCDQRAITGSGGELPGAGLIVATVCEWLQSSGEESVEVAFYGGSFTLLSRSSQESLLAPLRPLLESSLVSGVRISTRPDAIDPETAAFLSGNGVSTVELGVQSMDDKVLNRSGRGHTTSDTVDAFACLRAAGLRVGVQMMPGLPGESAAGAVASFRKALKLAPDLARIYPAVVLEGTELAAMHKRGDYQPLQLREAIAICKVMLHDADLAGVPVVRVGLQPTADLSAGGRIAAGPYHPAFRQLAQGERWFDLLQILAENWSAGDKLSLSVSPGEISDVVGQKRKNISRFEAITGLSITGVSAEESLKTGQICMKSATKEVRGKLRHDLTYS